MNRYVLLAIGWSMVALGILGAFLPLLPTTPFLILAAWCFSRSSPRLHAWLLKQPKLGPVIQEWEKNKVIRPHIKLYSVTIMIMGGTISWWKLDGRPWPFRVILILLLGYGAYYVLKQRSRPQQESAAAVPSPAQND